GYRSALGVIRLSDRYGKARMEAACARALHLKVCTYKSVKSILERGLDRQPLPESKPLLPPLEHENVRGPDYYAGPENKPEVGSC
ncbi:MAG TPA: IS21 family transposase, partial [Candidatus Angelobacter sp.]